MDEEDESTLSNCSKSLLRGASSLAKGMKRRHSKTCNAFEINQTAKGMKNSPLQSSAKGDIVWAKASPSTWWPCQVKSFKGSLISISFFGCNKIRWFNPSEILRFEETYPRMVKMVGVKLSYEIGLALDELARNIAMGLKCCCRVPAADEGGLLAVKTGFNPLEILRFLRDKAVLPQVIEEEIATVVRVSAALNAFRYGLVVCNTSEVDEGFCSEGVLDFVLDMAVNQFVDDKTVAQLSAFRRFASVKPSWVYQLDWKFEEDSLESHKIEVDLELPDCTSEDDLYHGRTRDPVVDVSVKPQEKYELLGVNHKPEGSEMCMINMIDFSFFDTDEKYESLTYDQHLVDADGGQAQGRGMCRNTSQERTLHSCTEGASGMPGVATNETADNVICASVDSKLVISTLQNDPDHMIQVGEEVNFIRSIVPNLENATGEGSTSIPARSDKRNSVEVPSPAENPSLRTVPFYTGQLQSHPTNKCSIVPPFRVLNIAMKPLSRPEVRFNTSNAAQCIDLIPQMAPFAETALQISANKRKLYEPTTFENYKSAQISLPFKTIAPPATNFTQVDNMIHRALSEANGGNDAIKPHFRNKKCFSGHVSKYYCRNRRQNHHPQSNYKAFYISPLMRDGLHSTNRSNSLNSNNRVSSSVLLNMKFPKDYTLPSKEHLEKKFRVFGPLDRTRTRVFFYTGVGQVVFLHQADAVVAYNYITRKRLFCQANVRFWFYKYEDCRHVSSNVPGSAHSSLNLKPCLKKSYTPELIHDGKNSRMRFTM